MVRSRAFRAIAEVVVPEAARLDEAGWQAFGAIIEQAVSQRPARMQRQLALFVRILGVLSWLRFGKPIHRLNPAARTAFLEGIQNSRLLLIRRGFWGIRTLILMGYYARPDVIPVIGYRAHVRGWEARA